MSMNLTLRDDVAGCEFNLWQTPTTETYRILEFGTHDEKIKNYMAWLTSGFKNGKKKLDKYDKEMLQEHELKLRKFINGHPNCKWGYI
jgi:hypothetical protein